MAKNWRDLGVRLMKSRIWVLLPIACIPSFVSMAFIIWTTGSSLSGYWPTVSDDVIANHQIRTFAVSGFSGGYYTIDEIHPQAAFSPFGTHGPIYSAIYGSLMAPVGPVVSGPVWLHHILLAASLFGGFLLLRPATAWQPLVAAIVVGTFWPSLSMLSTSMQEGLHASIAVLLAFLVVHIQVSPRSRIGVLALLGLALLIRPTWAPMLLAALRRPDTVMGLAIRAILMAVAMLAAFVIFRYLAAPAPRGIVERLPDMSSADGIAEAARHVAQTMLINLSYLVSPTQWQTLEAHVFILSALILIIAPLQLRSDWATASVALTLLMTWVALCAAYDFGNYRAFRLVAPLLLCAMLVAVLRAKPRWLALALIVVNIFAAPAYTSFVIQHRVPLYSGAEEQFAKMREKLEEHLGMPSESDAWCNTMLVDHPDIGAPLATLPAGMGISVASVAGQIPDAPKSGYIWQTAATTAGLPVVVSLPSFRVVTNQDSGCHDGR